MFLGRRVYAVFGVIGIALYLGDLADKVFRDSLLFPFALSLIGVAVIAAGPDLLPPSGRRSALGSTRDCRRP